MTTATHIKLQHVRHCRPICAPEIDIDALIETAKQRSIAEFHYDEPAVSEFVFDDGSSMTVYHAEVEVFGSDSPPTELVAGQSTQERARGRVGLMKSLVAWYRGVRQ